MRYTIRCYKNEYRVIDQKNNAIVQKFNNFYEAYHLLNILKHIFI